MVAGGAMEGEVGGRATAVRVRRAAPKRPCSQPNSNSQPFLHKVPNPGDLSLWRSGSARWVAQDGVPWTEGA